jgi:hypothetical protein
VARRAGGASVTEAIAVIVAEGGRVATVVNMGVTGTGAIIKIADHWTVRDGKVTPIWVAYFEPQALLDKLGVAHKLPH